MDMENIASMGKPVSELCIGDQEDIIPRCSGMMSMPPSPAFVYRRSEDSPVPDASGNSCSLWARGKGMCGREGNSKIGRGL